MNIVRDANKTYSIVHIVDSGAIACQVKMNDAFKDELICHFESAILKPQKMIENRYFKIDFSNKQVRISPKYHFEYYPIKKDFLTDDTIGVDKDFLYTHWIITGFEGKSILYGKESEEGLSFPITFYKDDLPAIGELDFDLNPLNNNINANAIVKIREQYKKKNFKRVLKECDFLLEEKKSIFTKEAKLYKIRALDKILNDQEQKAEDDGLDPLEIIDLAHEWIAENPSNDNLAEMYMYIAKTHLNLGRTSKAKKFLDILETEYSESRFNYLAKLAHADKIYKVKSKDIAIEKYKEVLYGTNDFDIASIAALKLTFAYIEKKQMKKAKTFFDKVITANKPFIKSHADETYRLAKSFAENNETNVSIQIATLLQNDIKNSSLNLDEIKKNIAYWYEKDSNNDKAIELYKQYLDVEEYGKYRDFVTERLDKVMLNADEKNETKKLAYLDSIMTKYKDDAIYAKALLAKAEILLKNGALEKILEQKETLMKHGGKSLLEEVAKQQLVIYYHDKKCKEAYNLEVEYNLTVQEAQKEISFHCYSELGHYDKALAISREKMKSKALDEKLKWTYNSAKIYKKQGKNKALILASDDVDKLQKIVKTTKYNDLIYDKIEAYYQLGGYDELMINEVQKCEKIFPNAVRNLDVFEKVLMYAKKNRESSLIINYAKKMIDLQEKYKLDTYTPKVQLDYINALREKSKYKEALDEVLKLLYKKLNDTQRAHVLYLAGDLSERFKKFKEAKEFYIKCGEIVEDSAWIELCSENLQLLDE